VRTIWCFAAILAVSGCGSADPPRSSSPEEQSYEHAKRLGLTRDDAVRVSAPAEARSPAEITFRIDVPKATKTVDVQADLSGDCTAALTGGKRRIVVPVEGGKADVVVHARLPEGRAECTVTLDASAPGRIDTGDGKTVNLRR
jgi:hypothetical protein